MAYVIIGNGVAGVSAAESIRQLDRDGRIVMIGDETEIPYCRPMISLVLEGAIPADRLTMRADNFYETMGIEPVLGRRVDAIDVAQKTVRVGGDTEIPYTKLLIASGADPRPITADGLNLKNIFFMRTQAQVRDMLQVLPDARRALVLGGGLVGFKAAYGLLRRGLNVTMLIRSGYPLSMQADETAGGIILQELRRKGLDVKVGTEAVAFGGNGAVREAHLSDGDRTPCDMVVIGKGVLPALSFVPRERIEIDLGIVIDRHMRTSAEDVYAAGDVAEGVDVARKTRWVNAIWPEAVTQGRLAGINMAGRPVSGEGSLGRNVIRIFDLDILTGGVVTPPDNDGYDVFQTFDGSRNTYRKLVFQGDRLVGVVLVNDIEQGGVFLSVMSSKTPVTASREGLLSRKFNYKQLLK
ncbi:Nitrite reductase probable [NAD(P)H] subunit (EC [Olavius algarvensis associated proteobacterium Delta 3]|nr:Nitrite reductase probable [NAD(P)H] subunit (EC [Olavius algarvensis associated proteobacterium Delta 3]